MLKGYRWDDEKKKVREMEQRERRRYLIRRLLEEKKEYAHDEIPDEEQEQKRLLRALMNLRLPGSMDQDFLSIQDDYLQEEIKEKGITDLTELKEYQPGLFLWQGDITTLRCDAIVNAANAGMTGCYVPNHGCIDNAIHSYAGIQLRDECANLMHAQGHDEPTGSAKITRAYNLPSSYILHTVGPIIHGEVWELDMLLLARSYLSCLNLAEQHELKSIAFCCISTGEFRFPNQLAAEIAVNTVKGFMKKKRCIQKVIFNVFKDEDREIYERLLDESK